MNRPRNERGDTRRRRPQVLVQWLILIALVALFVAWLWDRARRLSVFAPEADWPQWAVLTILIAASGTLLASIASRVMEERRSEADSAIDRRLVPDHRTELLTMVARELRDPVRRLASHAVRLREGRHLLSAAERNRHIENLAVIAEDLEAALDDLYVDVATSLDRLTINRDIVELRTMAESVISKASQRAVRSTSIRGAATAYVDPTHSAQVLRSMLRVAALHRATTIAVEIGVEHSTAIVTVVDDAAPWTPETRSALDTSEHERPTGTVEHSVETAAGLAMLMEGELRYERGDGVNRLSLRVPMAHAAVRGPSHFMDVTTPDDDRVTTAEIQQVIEDGPERIFFQPIVDLADTDRVVGFEALSRFGRGSPVRWFSAAARAGLQLDLELACIRKAVWSARDITDGFVAINLSSGLLVSDDLFDALVGIEPRRVVLELSENSQIDHFETTSEDMLILNGRGFTLALDDVGNSEVDLWRIVRLRPAIVKLDLSLARGIDRDADRRAVASAMIAVAHAIDATVIAEGIETPSDLQTMIDLGADLGQGFLFDEAIGTVRG